MKTMKSILIAATLICASVVSTLSAQQADAPAYEWKVAIGDSVMIKRECDKYLTGEQPSVWVYDKVHTVKQLGTKRFPEGVLLMNIYSWICEECLVPVNPREPKKALAVVPAPAPVAEPEPVVEEPAPVAEPEKETVVVEEPVVEEPVKEEPVAEEIAPEQPTETKAEVKVEQIKGDSVKSQEHNFRHGYDRFTIGVRGGASSLLHNVTKGKWTCGGDAVLDLQYAHYWTKDGRPVDLGIITGLSVGYSQSGMKAAVNSTKQVTDSEGTKIDYTVKADEVNEADGQIQLEIPVMFSLLHTNGLFFNAGVRCMMPVYTPYNQKISNNENTYIDAYFPDYGVNVTNKEITGKLAENQYKSSGSDNGNQFAFNLMLGAEIGYEWILKSGNSLGLGAYANYCVYSTFKNDDASRKSLIQVTPPLGGSMANVEVLSATKTYAEKLGYFDAGIKLAYHFNFPKKKQFKDDQLF